MDHDIVCYSSLRKKSTSNSSETVSIFYHICPNSCHNLSTEHSKLFINFQKFALKIDGNGKTERERDWEREKREREKEKC